MKHKTSISANGSRIFLISASLISQPLQEILEQERLIERWLAAGQEGNRVCVCEDTYAVIAFLLHLTCPLRLTGAFTQQ